MASITENNQRIARNTLMLYIRMFVSLIISIYTSRIVFNVLGVDNYGIFNVVGGIIVLFSILNSSMILSTQRFITYELGLGEKGNPNHIFNTAVLSHLLTGLVVLFLAETIGVWFVNNYLNIPDEKIYAANWVFQFSIFTTVIAIIQTPYTSSIIAVEKMGIYAYLSILDIVLKLLIVFLLQILPGDVLIIYGALLFAVSLINNIVVRWYCRRKVSFCRYRFEWDKLTLKKMLLFSGWTLGGEVTSMGIYQGRSILINIFYSVQVNAALGVANQLCNVINNFVANFRTAFNPQLTKSYAAQDFGYLRQLLFRSSKFSYFLLFILCVPVFSETPTLLKVWLGSYPEYTVAFCRAILVLMLVGALSAPLVTIIFATGEIRNYQTGVVVLNIINITGIFLLLYFHFSPVTTIWIHVLMEILLMLWRLRIVRRRIRLSVWEYLKKIFTSVVFVSAVVIPIIYAVNHSLEMNPLAKLVVVTAVSSILCCSAIYILGLDVSERAFIWNTLRKLKLKILT